MIFFELEYILLFIKQILFRLIRERKSNSSRSDGSSVPVLLIFIYTENV